MEVRLRAFRYCQHDCGHALAALSYASTALGWPVRLLADWGDDEIAALTGIARVSDFADAEAEEPEALVWVGSGAAPAAAEVLAMLTGAKWTGHANALSPHHRDWRDIPAVTTATRKPAGIRPAAKVQPVPLPPLEPVSREPVSHLIRTRRSAQSFDGLTAISAQSF
jgi:hypothetical protein